MENILLLDTSVATLNRGDDIIMRCVRDELDFLLKDNFVLNVPTHLSPFHSYQVWKKSPREQLYENCRYKFVCGTNLLVPDMVTTFPQWNLNCFNYRAVSGALLVGVGKGAGDQTNHYTTWLYKKLLNHELIHSVRDERSREYMESMGFKVLNTGCVTMWMLTPEFCKEIPTEKADNVVFTLTARRETDPRDQQLIDALNRNYKKVSFWVQGHSDYGYLHRFQNIDQIEIIPASVDAYEAVLNRPNLDYVGTRLHAGVFAMRHKKRAVIIAIDERARGINEVNHLNCIEKDEIKTLDTLLNRPIVTAVEMPFDKIEQWKNQFR